MSSGRDLSGPACHYKAVLFHNCLRQSVETPENSLDQNVLVTALTCHCLHPHSKYDQIEKYTVRMTHLCIITHRFCTSDKASKPQRLLPSEIPILSHGCIGPALPPCTRSMMPKTKYLLKNQHSSHGFMPQHCLHTTARQGKAEVVYDTRPTDCSRDQI